MSRFVRASKYRHVFGKEAKREDSYDQIKVTRSAWDTNKVACSTEFWGCIWEAGGGGAFVVKAYDQKGKAAANPPLIAGHKAPVLDIAFSPFNPFIVASSSEDCMVKIWTVPEGGLKENMTEESQLLKGHKRKAGTVDFHPTANNVLVSSATDYLVKFWDIEAGECKLDIKGHSNIIQSIDFNWDGSLITTSSKDKKFRVIDPRSGETTHEVKSHEGIKGQRVVWLGRENKVITVGFSRTSDRQYAVWDLANTDKAIAKANIDTSSGQLMPFYDADTAMLYLAGKGDGNVRYYEVTNDDKFIYYLNEYKSSIPQKGMGLLPKRANDIPACEVARFYKVTSKNMVTPLSFKVPRKSDLFQDDIFPDGYAGEPALDAGAWFDGENADRKLMNMEPENMPEKKVYESNFAKKEEEKELTHDELKVEYEKLQKRVAYLEAEIVKKDAKISELSS